MTTTTQDPTHPKPRRRRHPTFSHMWHRQTLDVCMELAGPPALVSVIASFVTADQKILAASALIALLIAIGLRFFPRITETHALRLVIPWLLVLGLGLVLLLVLVVQPRRTESLSQQWLEWQRTLEKSVSGLQQFERSSAGRLLKPNAGGDSAEPSENHRAHGTNRVGTIGDGRTGSASERDGTQ